MRRKNHITGTSAILIMLASINGLQSSAQDIQFSIFADPTINWLSSDTRESVNKGALPGFSVGLYFDKYFAENYAFSTGLVLTNSSGRLSYSDTINLEFKNSIYELPGGEDINYKIQYLSVPLGIKLKTNQIGYINIFVNAGLNPGIAISSKADIPSGSIEDENIEEEINMFNLGYHLAAGIEYSLGGNTSLAFGLGYDNNFIDITKDNEGQPVDKIRQNIVRFKLGINF